MMLRAYSMYFFPTGSYLKQYIRSSFPAGDAPIFPSDASIRASFRSRGSIPIPYRYRETVPPGERTIVTAGWANSCPTFV